MTWGSSFGSTDGRVIESTAAVTFNDWSHVMQHSIGATTGILYVNGVAVAVSPAGQFYQPHAGGADLDLTIGANLDGNGNFFTGTIDNPVVYVAGDNTDDGGTNYGTFNLGTDNEFIVGLGLVPGDATGEGSVLGDGTGDPSVDDVAFFVEHWGDEQVINGVFIGDLNSRQNQADFNYDGVTDLADWFILRANHPTPGSLDLGALLNGSGSEVPEPSALVLSGLALCGYLLVRRRNA